MTSEPGSALFFWTRFLSRRTRCPTSLEKRSVSQSSARNFVGETGIGQKAGAPRGLSSLVNQDAGAAGTPSDPLDDAHVSGSSTR